jgi:hypothetical protein
MAVLIEDYVPVVKFNGLNTAKAVDFSGAASVALPSGTTSTSAVLTTPVITGGLTASGSGANTFTASTGTFVTSTGANTLSGDVTIAAGKDIAMAAGDGLADFSLGTGIFKTSTGAATIGTGALSVTSSSSTFDNAVFINAATNYRRQVTDTGGAYATPIALTAAQSGRVILVDEAAGLDFTLPALTSAEVGVHYKFVVTVTVSSNNFRVTAASGDLLFGGLLMQDFDTADKSLFVAPDGNDLVVTMNGSTTGGKQGTWVEFIASSATQWLVTGVAVGDGTLATPFS